MKFPVWSIRWAIVLGTATSFGLVSHAQATVQSALPQVAAPRANPSPASQPTDPSLVTLNVVAQDAKTSAILPKLSREDFRLFDNGRETPIVSFGAGAHYSVPPLALWLVLECNNFGQVDFASAFGERWKEARP
jgi:hypothetical protein